MRACIFCCFYLCALQVSADAAQVVLETLSAALPASVPWKNVFTLEPANPSNFLWNFFPEIDEQKIVFALAPNRPYSEDDLASGRPWSTTYEPAVLLLHHEEKVISCSFLSHRLLRCVQSRCVVGFPTSFMHNAAEIEIPCTVNMFGSTVSSVVQVCVCVSVSICMCVVMFSLFRAG